MSCLSWGSSWRQGCRVQRGSNLAAHYCQGEGSSLAPVFVVQDVGYNLIGHLCVKYLCTNRARCLLGALSPKPYNLINLLCLPKGESLKMHKMFVKTLTDQRKSTFHWDTAAACSSRCLCKKASRPTLESWRGKVLFLVMSQPPAAHLFLMRAHWQSMSFKIPLKSSSWFPSLKKTIEQTIPIK